MKFKKTILAVIVLSIALVPMASAANFEDTRGHWAEYIIDRLADKGVVNGVSDTRFNPDGTVTRAEFLKMAMGAVGISETAYREGECLDVAASAWYAPCVQSALDKGLILEYMIDDYSADVTENGVRYGGFFRAEIPIKREEMAYIAQSMYQYSMDKGAAALKNLKDMTFDDVRMISIWALDGVRQAYTYGLVSGMDDGTFAPQSTATRAQAATIISNILDKVE